MSTERSYKQAKKELRKELGLTSKDKSVNFHHIFFRSDREKHRLPDNFRINDLSNLIPLPIHTHEELHFIDDHYFHKDISTRVYLANMAYSGDLCDVPDRIYYVMPQVRKVTP